MPDLNIPIEIVPELRRGLLVAMGSAAERLAMLALSGELTHVPTYQSALWTVTATSSLLDTVGPVKPPVEHAVSLPEDQHIFLLYRVLRDRHEWLVQRRQDAAISHGSPEGSVHNQVLEQFVGGLRRRLTGSPSEREERRLLVAINVAHIES